MALPQGLVGMLQGKNFVKPKKAAPAKKKANPAAQAAIKRKLAAGPPVAPSDNDGDEFPYK